MSGAVSSLAERARAWADGYRRRDRVAGDLGEIEWRMMLTLAIEGGVTVGSLCLASGCPQTTGLRYVANLELRGWIASEGHPGDRRSRILSLTDAGRAVLERAA